MLEIQKIGLRNIVVHNNTNFEFENGITVVRGKNAAGKSLLFSVIPNVFDGAPPLAKKKDAKILHSESQQSGIALKYKWNDALYTIIQKAEKGSVSYKIKKQDQDITPRTTPMAKELVSKIFPISTDQYYSLVHLTPYRPSILLSGNGTQRKEFFENLFKLNYGDIVLEKLKAKLNELKRNQDEKQILLDQLSEMQYVEDIDQLIQQYNCDKQQYGTLNEQYQLLVRNNSTITSYNTLVEQISDKNNLQLDDQQITAKIEQMQTRCDTLQDSIEQYKTNKANFENYKNTMAEIRSKHKQIKDIKLVEDASEQQLFDDYQSIVQQGKALNDQKIQYEKDQNEIIAQAQKLNNDIEKYQQLSNTLNKWWKSQDDYLSQYNKAKVSIDRNIELIGKFEKLKGQGVCPTCGQTLNDRDLIDLIKKLQEENDQMSEITENHELVMQYFDYQQRVLDSTTQNIEEMKQKLQEELDQYERKLDKIRQDANTIRVEYEKAKQIHAIKDSIKALEKTCVVCNEPDQQEFERNKVLHESEIQKLAALRNDKQILSRIAMLGAIPEKQEDYNVVIEKLGEQLHDLNECITQLNTQIQVGNNQNNTIETKRKRIAEIDKMLIDMPVYEALVKAYSAKGIRITQIKSLADLYCANLNKYKNLVFNKDIKFYVNVDSTNFNIYAERNGKPMADVFTLSGQESRCFCLLSLLALLPFVPPALRTDYVILDEIEAGITDENRKIISQNFFKVLQDIIPKIIIVTPMSQQEFYVESDREYFIDIENGYSVIKKEK